MFEPLLKIVPAFLLSFLVTTCLIRWGIPRLDSGGDSPNELPESHGDGRIFDLRSTGFWIGFCETLLVFAFVYQGQYEALAIIVGAKQFVRKENIQKNPSYYLLGTLINISLALLFALGAKAWLEG